MITLQGVGETHGPRPAKPLSPLQASWWLAVILIAGKAACADPASAAGWSTKLLTLVASSFSDVLFALACGAFGEIVVLALSKWRRGAAIARALWLALFAIFATYGVVAVGIFRYFHRPLTYDLLGLIGNASAVRSSIVARITWPLALALLGAPALFLVLALRKRARSRRWAVFLAGASMWIAVGWSLQRRGWQHEQLEFLWLSPHVELLRTTARRVTGASRPSFPRDFPPEYVNEFRMFGARTSRPDHGFNLPPGTPRPRNVIVVVLESVGAKYLGLYGSPDDITPNLTAAAENALVFENIYAHASFTYASFRPINFSVYPGVPWHYALLQDARPLPQTLASAMRARGSRTAYFTSGDLDWGDQRWLLERGGDFGALQGAADLGCSRLSSWGTEDRCAFERLIDWLGEKPDESFYVVCWTDQTHDPFLASPGARTGEAPAAKTPFADDLARYLANLYQVDEQLGQLFAALRLRGLADDTLVVVTGDHGEAFADPHGQRGHSWSVYEEEVRVPLLFWNPRLFPQPQRAATIGGHVDLNPTIADLLGVTAPNEWQGHSLFDPARPPRAYFMAIAGGNVFGVREADWKYIYDVTSGRESLFDLAEDPQERIDKSATQPERCLDLRRRVAAWVTFEDAYLWGREN